MKHSEGLEGARVHARKVLTGILVVLTLHLGACATGASRTFTVDVAPESIQYTPRQIRTFLEDRGFERVKFHAFADDVLVYEKVTSEVVEQRFRLKRNQQIGLIVWLEKYRRLFGNPGPRLVVKFIEHDHGSLSKAAQEEYDHLIAQVIERMGADRVRQ